MQLLLGYPVEEQHVEQIQHAAPSYELVIAQQSALPDALMHADLFCGHVKVPVDWPAIVAQQRLKWIQSSAAGLDHCLHSAVVESDIVVSSASGVLADQVAEHTMALIGAVIRQLPVFFSAQQHRSFVRRPTRDLHGKQVGIVGFGGVGQRLAELLAPYGVRMVATDYFPLKPPVHVSEVWPPEDLPRLLAESDVVVLCVPLTEQTRGMIGEAELRMMQREAVLINVCRGGVVIEEALGEALQNGRIAGAAIDVTRDEPLAGDSPLWETRNLVITPHVAGQSALRIDQMTNFLCKNLKRYQAGEPPFNLVDKQLGFPVPEGLD